MTTRKEWHLDTAAHLHIWPHSSCDNTQKIGASLSQNKPQRGEDSWAWNLPLLISNICINFLDSNIIFGNKYYFIHFFRLSGLILFPFIIEPNRLKSCLICLTIFKYVVIKKHFSIISFDINFKMNIDMLKCKLHFWIF